jgi:hypothetical protein
MSETYGRPSSGRAGLQGETGRKGNGLGDSQGEVLSTLRALEEKLRALEHELSSAESELDPAGFPSPEAAADDAPPPAPPPPTAPPPPPLAPREPAAWTEPGDPAPPLRLPRRQPLSSLPRSSEQLGDIVAEARARMSELQGQVDDLLHFRDHLRASAQELIADYRQVLDADAALPTDGAPPAAAPPGADLDPRRVELGGELRVLLDAGPFTDLATLASFEQALTRIPEMQDVYVRSFQDARASIELTLSRPVPLVDRMQSVASQRFEVIDVSPDQLTIDLEPAAAGPRHS